MDDVMDGLRLVGLKYKGKELRSSQESITEGSKQFDTRGNSIEKRADQIKLRKLGNKLRVRKKKLQLHDGHMDYTKMLQSLPRLLERIH